MYSVVIEALKPLEGDRKCHRLVNGVLVERTVSQVLPALTLNFDNVITLNTNSNLYFIILFFVDEKTSFRTCHNLQKPRRRTSQIKELVDILK